MAPNNNNASDGGVALHHSASADDLLLLHTKSTLHDALHEPQFETNQDRRAHSEEELDDDDSSITLRPETPLSVMANGQSQTQQSQPVEIAFSASGGAFVYQMGIAAYIQEHFDLSNCHFSGCSGGSWAATLLAADTSVQKAWEIIQKTQKMIVPENARWYTGYGRYATIVAETIKELWKDDPEVHLRVQQRNLAIAVTRFPSMKAERHTSWTDLEDLMKSILASAMIPFALSGKLCISHRGKWYIDGGVTNFKGVNCDQYSTLSDMYYHGVQMAVDSVKYTTSKIADWFFPSLTKPVARLVHNILPQMQSPHDAVAPRLTNASGSATDMSDTSRPRIILKPWTWRSHHVTAFHLTVDLATHQQRFDMGYEDALAHHHEFAALLPLKTPLQT